MGISKTIKESCVNQYFLFRFSRKYYYKTTHQKTRYNISIFIRLFDIWDNSCSRGTFIYGNIGRKSLQSPINIQKHSDTEISHKEAQKYHTNFHPVIQKYRRNSFNSTSFFRNPNLSDNFLFFPKKYHLAFQKFLTQKYGLYGKNCPKNIRLTSPYIEGPLGFPHSLPDNSPQKLGNNTLYA